MIDLIDLVRSIAAEAARAEESTNYPSPCTPGSPLLASVRQACVERGFAASGVAVSGATAAASQVVAERTQNNPQAHTWPAEIWLQVGDCDNGAEMTYDAAMRNEVTWCAESIDKNDVRYVRAATPVQAQKPVALLTLGGIDGDEYGDNDSEVVSSKAVEKLQEQLVRGQNPVVLELFAGASPARPVAVPDGWKLVPLDPTTGMINALYHDGYTEMLDAAPAAPAAQGDAKDLTDDEIVQAVRSVGVDTHPSKFGFSEEQIEGMSVTVLRQVIAAIAAKAVKS